jgi:hypothetical protein
MLATMHGPDLWFLAPLVRGRRAVTAGATGGSRYLPPFADAATADA